MEPSSFLVIPQDYNPGNDTKVIPIYVRLADDEGRPIHVPWVTRGLAPVPGRVVSIAGRYLGDVWRASELADRVIQVLSQRRGSNLGDRPDLIVLATAQSTALTLAAGDYQHRKHPQAFLALDAMDSALKEALVVDRGYLRAEDEIDEEVLHARLASGLQVAARNSLDKKLFAVTLAMLRAGHRWPTIGKKLATDHLALKKRFYRAAHGLSKTGLGHRTVPSDLF